MFCAAFLLSPAAEPRAQAVPGSGATAAAGLTPAELEAAFDQLEALGRFFGALAERDTNGFARDRWRRLGVNYRSTAVLLRSLLAQGDLVIDDLPPGRSSALLDDGRIVIDRRLDGRWSSDPLRLPAAGDAAVRRRDLLEPVLMQALARRYLSQDWQWLADHLRAVGALGDLAQQPLARPLLARFFQAKDAYLWLALQRISTGAPEARMALARRQAATFETLRALRGEMAATFGAEAADQVQRDWTAYVAQVDGFAVTRGWVLLDPSLRQIQIGADTPLAVDAVDHAAAEMLAEAPRSAVAAAGGISKPKRGAPSPATKLPGVNLAAVMPPPAAPTVAELAAGLPLDVLAWQPQPPANAGGTAAFRAFAARVKEALAQPDPRRVIARQQAALGAAEKELDSLKTRVAELDQGLRQRSAAASELEAALAAERARLAAAERRAAEQAATAETLSAEVETLSALEPRVAELDAALAAQSAETAALETALAAERDRLAEAERRAAEEAATAASLTEEVQALSALEMRLAELDGALAAERARLAAAERRAAEQAATAETLSAEVATLSALEPRVAELDAALAARAAETAALETALAAERARLAEAERRAAEEAAAAASLTEEVRALSTLEARLAELDAALAARNREAEALAAELAEEQVRQAAAARQAAEAERQAAEAQRQAAEAQRQAAAAAASREPEAADQDWQDVAALLLRIEQRQLLLIGAIAVIFLLGLLLWLRSRRLAAAPPALPPLLLTAPAQEEPRPVIDLVETPGPEDSEEAPEGFTPQPGSLRKGASGPRVYGVAPQTPAARAAMKAGTARTEAGRAATLDSERDAAGHPIVQALRKGNLPLFELLFSELTGLRAPRLQRIVYGGHGEDLAIVCRAVGIDKLLFGSIYLLTDSFRGGDADEESERTAEILRMYDRMPPATAKKVLAKWQRNWGEAALNKEEEESLA